MGRAGAGGGGRSVGGGGHSAGRTSGGHSMGSSRPGGGSSGMGMSGMNSSRSGMGSGRPSSMGSSNRSGMNNGMGGMSHGPGVQPQRNPSPARTPAPGKPAPAPAPKPAPAPDPHRHVAPPPRRTGPLGSYRLRRRYYNPCPYGLIISSTLTYLQLQAACDALYRMMSGTERPGDAMAVSVVFGRYLTVAEYAMCYEWLCSYMDCWGI